MEYIKKYIHVSVLGTVAGITVSAFTYTAMMSALQNTALGTDIFCSIISDIFKVGTTYLCGDIAGQSVKLIIKHIGHTSKKTIDVNSHIVAGATALTAGTLATATVVIGEYIVYYGIEYGGKITQEVVGFVSESAVKLTNTLALKIHAHDQLISDDWQLVGPIDYELLENSVEIKNGLYPSLIEISTDNFADITEPPPQLPNLEQLINDKLQGELGELGGLEGLKDTVKSEKELKDTVKSEKELKDTVRNKQSHNQRKKFKKQQSTTLDDSFFPYVLE